MAADERFHPFVPKPMANESPITAGKGPGAYAVVTWLLTATDKDEDEEDLAR